MKDILYNALFSNPNMYGWVSDLEFIAQDIPMPVKSKDVFLKQVEATSEEALSNKKRASLEKLKTDKTDTALVSVDNPNKYDIVKQFIIDKGLKVYGGVAINAYLSKQNKIYEDDAIPDYDFFSPDPWNDAVELTLLFYSHGYKYPEAKAGIHKGTYKVFVDLWPVADITFIPKEYFDKIDVVLVDGLPIVSPFKLLESLYKEFSEPFSNPVRWNKVAYREKLLQKDTKLFKRNYNCYDAFKKIKLPEIVDRLLIECMIKVKEMKMILSSDVAYNIFVQLSKGSKLLFVSSIECLDENAFHSIQEIYSHLLTFTPHLDITTEYIPVNELNNHSYSIVATHENIKYEILKITLLTSCTPYITVQGVYIVGIDYVIFELFNKATYGNEKEKEVAKCKLKYLLTRQAKYYKSKGITEFEKSPFQRLITTCRGKFQENQKVALLEKMIEKINTKKRTITEWKNDYKIKKIPYEVIAPECLNKSQTECVYPCGWIPGVEKCTNNIGLYRPFEVDD